MSISDLVLPSAPPCSLELALVPQNPAVGYHTGYPDDMGGASGTSGGGTIFGADNYQIYIYMLLHLTEDTQWLWFFGVLELVGSETHVDAWKHLWETSPKGVRG